MAIKDLGDLGQDVLAEDVEFAFGFHGARIRVNSTAGELGYFKFMGEAATVEEDDPRAYVMLMDFLRSQIHEDDFDTFFDIAQKRRYGIEKLMKVSRAIIEAVSGFPTKQQADSQDGPQQTRPSLKGASSSRDTGNAKERVERALQLLPGRPDLKAAVIRANEDRLPA